MSALDAMVAVYGGPSTTLIHLYLPGYRIGSKHRSSLTDAALCGVTANHTTPPPVGPKPTGRVWVAFPKAVAREREFQARLATVVEPDDPWLMIKDRRFCGKCLGLAVVHAGLTDQVLNLLIEEASQ